MWDKSRRVISAYAATIKPDGWRRGFTRAAKTSAPREKLRGVFT